MRKISVISLISVAALSMCNVGFAGGTKEKVRYVYLIGTPTLKFDKIVCTDGKKCETNPDGHIITADQPWDDQANVTSEYFNYVSPEHYVGEDALEISVNAGAKDSEIIANLFNDSIKPLGEDQWPVFRHGSMHQPHRLSLAFKTNLFVKVGGILNDCGKVNFGYESNGDWFLAAESATIRDSRFEFHCVANDGSGTYVTFYMEAIGKNIFRAMPY